MRPKKPEKDWNITRLKKKDAPKQSYRVVRPFKIGGELYKKGDPLNVTGDIIKVLIRNNIIR